MRTGRYRTRKNLLGQAVLQMEFNSPSYIGGQVDSSLRVIDWVDCMFGEVSHMTFLATQPSSTPPHPATGEPDLPIKI